MFGRAQKSVQDVLERVRIAVVKFGIRTPDFFSDYDKLRSGLVTEAQFAAALTLAVGRQAQLAPDEVRRLAEFYRDQSDARGKVNYRALCDWLETGYNVAHLEKNVQRDPTLPPAGSLYKVPLHTLLDNNLSSRAAQRTAVCACLVWCAVQHKATLSYEEEERAARVLQQLADEVLRRRLQLWPFFRDFDRVRPLPIAPLLVSSPFPFLSFAFIYFHFISFRAFRRFPLGSVPFRSPRTRRFVLSLCSRLRSVSIPLLSSDLRVLSFGCSPASAAQ